MNDWFLAGVLVGLWLIVMALFLVQEGRAHRGRKPQDEEPEQPPRYENGSEFF